jgi:hypothetical protein
VKYRLLTILVTFPIIALAADNATLDTSILNEHFCLHPSKSSDAESMHGRTKTLEQKKRELIFLKEHCSGDNDDSNETSITDLKSELANVKSSLKDDKASLAKTQEKASTHAPLLRIYRTLNNETKLSEKDMAYLQELLKRKIAKIENQILPVKNKISTVQHKINALRESKIWEDRDKADVLEEGIKESLDQIKDSDEERKKYTDYQAWLAKGAHGDSPQTDLFDNLDTSSSPEDFQASIKDYLKSIKENESQVKTLQAKIQALDHPVPTSAIDTKFKKAEDYAIDRCMSNRGQYQSCDLTVAELLAIENYTRSAYSSLNSALRSKDALAQSDKAFADVLSAALHKLTPIKGKVLRGTDVGSELRKKLVPGAIITLSAFTSTSVSQPFGGEDQFVIHSKTGRYIAPLSNSPGEEEVLFDEGTKFRVLSKKLGDRNEYVLEEVTGGK